MDRSPATSLNQACQIAADLASIPWARALLTYRALQQDGRSGAFLPVSRGRTIWKAQPNLLARFIIGLVATDDPTRAHDAVLRFGLFSVDGAGRSGEAAGGYISPVTLEDVIASHLARPDQRPALTHITFRPDEIPECAVVTTGKRGGKAENTIFRDGPRDWLPEAYRVRPLHSTLPMVRREIVLDGELIRAIGAAVEWGVGSPQRAIGDAAEEDAETLQG